MVDNVNPTNQFHPYQPERSTPNAERAPSGLGGMLEKFGLGGVGDSMKNMNMGDNLGKAREYARANPGKVLGGLAAAVIGAGLLRKR